MIKIEQIKAARVMLNLKQKELAKLAGISPATYNNIERGAQTDPKISTMNAISQALENEGIEFVNEPMGSFGVRLKPKRLADNATILIIDDSRADRTQYKNWLSKVPNKRFQILEAENAADGFEMFMNHHPQCIILDFMMYGTDGFQLLATLKKTPGPLPPIIFVTGMHNDIMEESALSHGVHTYLNKQKIGREELCHAVESALKHDH